MSVYLPDDLYAEVRSHGLPLSQLAQDAVRRALAEREAADWLQTMRGRLVDGPRSPGGVATDELMAAVADEFGA